MRFESVKQFLETDYHLERRTKQEYGDVSLLPTYSEWPDNKEQA
tara:strand:- start:1412 stop:1543 length:132 start_codon:yes stop_codon:yes gene_type:complete